MKNNALNDKLISNISFQIELLNKRISELEKLFNDFNLKNNNRISELDYKIDNKYSELDYKINDRYVDVLNCKFFTADEIHCHDDFYCGSIHATNNLDVPSLKCSVAEINKISCKSLTVDGKSVTGESGE